MSPLKFLETGNCKPVPESPWIPGENKAQNPFNGHLKFPREKNIQVRTINLIDPENTLDVPRGKFLKKLTQVRRNAFKNKKNIIIIIKINLKQQFLNPLQNL